VIDRCSGIVAGSIGPADALALDEALVRTRPEVPVLALWRSQQPAVVIGRFQRADWEVDTAACAERGVRVWRRFSGGGAVYLDGGTVCVALALPTSHPAATTGVPELYLPLLDGIVRALGSAGIEAERDERTVRVGGRKVTGIAAHRSAGGTLVHGTVLCTAQLDDLRACIAGPRDGDLDGLPRPAASRPDHVTNTGVGELEPMLLAAFGATIAPAQELLMETAAELRRQRYDDPAWHAGPWAAATSAELQRILGLPER
jgi:lipoate-protein ligase A